MPGLIADWVVLYFVFWSSFFRRWITRQYGPNEIDRMRTFVAVVFILRFLIAILIFGSDE